MNKDGGGLKTLPIGTFNFEKLRRRGHIYVDKTARLLELITNGDWYFLSRPRRFGKSLTISTLDAMFSGKAELFDGLAAESWVAGQSKHPSPVLRLDISLMDSSSVEAFETSLTETLRRLAAGFQVSLHSDTIGGIFQDLLLALCKAEGPVVVLIDEYDKPILDNIGNLEAAHAMRQTLRSFYSVLKGCDEYLRFVMLTGISKFTKTGVFSAMNNLQDISMHRSYGDIAGYTQAELEENFSGWIENAASHLSLDREELLDGIRAYYDGFCFDGVTRLYNPFSILNFFSEQEFKNYWYSSGSPSFIIAYMRQHEIKDPAEYSHITVSQDFADAHEIERATPESFLYQSGYLTIERKEEQSLTLDYPNREVLDSLSRMYLEQVYHVEGYSALGSDIWRALKGRDIAKVVELYNTALAGIPYEDYADQGERWYRSLFLMLLRGAGITANGEVHTSLGRSDALIQFPGRAVVLEFKYAKNGTGIKGLRQQGRKQIEEKGYAKPYDAEGREITTAVIVINGKKREAVL